MFEFLNKPREDGERFALLERLNGAFRNFIETVEVYRQKEDGSWEQVERFKTDEFLIEKKTEERELLRKLPGKDPERYKGGPEVDHRLFSKVAWDNKETRIGEYSYFNTANLVDLAIAQNGRQLRYITKNPENGEWSIYMVRVGFPKNNP